MVQLDRSNVVAAMSSSDLEQVKIAKMELRTRSSSVNYSDESREESHFSIRSTSNWEDFEIKHFRIMVVDVQDMFPRLDLPSEAQSLVIPEWNDDSWLLKADIKSLPCDNKVKTIIVKLRRIYMVLLSRKNITEVTVDGFMDSLLHLLCFDDYPCSVYPQYQYAARIKNNNITAKPDFSVLSERNKILLVIEDKTAQGATVINNWMEPQVLGELFVAVHDVVMSLSRDIKFQVNIYAVRVVETRFTFYKTVATLEYIKETSKNGKAVNDSGKVPQSRKRSTYCV